MHLSSYFSISWQFCWLHSFILSYCCPLMISSHCSTYTLASVIVEWARPCPSGHGCVQWARVCPVDTGVSKWARVCPVDTGVSSGHGCVQIDFQVLYLYVISSVCRFIVDIWPCWPLMLISLLFSSICRRHSGHTWLRSQIGRYQADRLLLQLPPYFYWPRRVNEKCRYDICTWLSSQIGQYQVRQISKTSNISDYNWNNFYRKQLYLTRLANRPIPGKTAAKDRR